MRLTRIEVETISIHMNAFKEKLCNQGRWHEAQEYQDIVDKLDELLTAESVIRCKDCGQREYGCSTFIDHNQIYGFCAWGWKVERKEE